MTLETLSFDAFSRRRDAWNALAEAVEHPLPFMTHEWLEAWWRHFGRGQEFVALVRRDGPRWLAAVPLALRRVRFAGGALTVAEIVGTGPVPTRGMGLSDRADLLVDRERPDEGRSLAESVAALLKKVDVVDLKGLDAEGPAARAVAAVGIGPRVHRLERSRSPFLPLPGSWDDYLVSRSGNFRKHLRKYWRNLGARGELDVAALARREDPGPWVDEILPVNAASWKGRRGTNLFRHPAIEAFFREVVRTMADAERIDLRVMRIDGRAVAYELCFDFGGRMFSYNSSFVADLARLSPGSALTADVIRAACERGRREYDMLRGEEAYKRRWSDRVRTEARFVLVAPRLRSRFFYRVGIDWKERLKRSERLREIDDRMSGWLSRLRHRG